MANRAATEKELGSLHNMLTKLFTKVLEKYEVEFAFLDNVQKEAVGDEILEKLLEIGQPDPRILSAVAKFLKDNEIMYDTEEIGKLGAQERRLKEMRERRAGNVINMQNIPLAGEA